MINQGDISRTLAVAEIYAYRGRFIDAARIYQSNGFSSKALSMYTDLRLFHKAQVCAKYNCFVNLHLKI